MRKLANCVPHCAASTGWNRTVWFNPEGKWVSICPMLLFSPLSPAAMMPYLYSGCYMAFEICHPCYHEITLHYYPCIHCSNWSKACIYQSLSSVWAPRGHHVVIDQYGALYWFVLYWLRLGWQPRWGENGSVPNCPSTGEFCFFLSLALSLDCTAIYRPHFMPIFLPRLFLSFLSSLSLLFLPALRIARPHTNTFPHTHALAFSSFDWLYCHYCLAGTISPKQFMRWQLSNTNNTLLIFLLHDYLLLKTWTHHR